MSEKNTIVAGSEQERAEIARARGRQAVSISDPSEKRAYIARQGNEESKERQRRAEGRVGPGFTFRGESPLGESYRRLKRDTARGVKRARNAR